MGLNLVTDKNINLTGSKNSETKRIWTTRETLTTNYTAWYLTSESNYYTSVLFPNCLDIAAATPRACQWKLRQ